MIVNVYSKNRQAQYAAAGSASVRAYYGNTVGGLTLEECCETITEYLQAILQVVTLNRSDILAMKKEQAEIRQKLWLLIAGIERTKKGRL